MDKETRKQSQVIINERIKEFLAKSGERSQRQFAYRTGINEMTLSDALRGTEPKFTTLEAILKAYPKLSAEWLMRGEGDMYRDDTPSPQATVPTENKTANVNGDDNNALLQLLRSQLAQRDEQIKQKDEQIRQKDEQLKQLLNLLSK